MHKVYTTFEITAFDRDAIENKWSAYVFMFHKLDYISYILFRNFFPFVVFITYEFGLLDARFIASAESKI